MQKTRIEFELSRLVLFSVLLTIWILKIITCKERKKNEKKMEIKKKKEKQERKKNIPKEIQKMEKPKGKKS